MIYIQACMRYCAHNADWKMRYMSCVKGRFWLILKVQGADASSVLSALQTAVRLLR